MHAYFKGVSHERVVQTAESFGLQVCGIETSEWMDKGEESDKDIFLYADEGDLERAKIYRINM